MADSNSESSNASEPLYQVRLLAALRGGDPAAIHPFLAEIGKDRRKSSEGEIDTGAAALHLAVRCASVQTVSLLLSHRAISPNGVHPPGSGTTPLHLAASLGRVDVVNLLLEQENIDDSLRDGQGKTCREVSRGKEVVRAIDDSRSFLNASYRSLLRSYILSPLSEPPSPSLLHLLDSPRISFVDLSYLDNDTGTSLLHEASRRKDLRLIELAVRAGADVFIRNRKGKMAHETAGKDDRVRVFLRQFANHDKTLLPNPTPPSEPPALKGYLNKYTNVAKGYNTRWFVLKDGVLSYYRHQEDESIASRGSISMKTAVLKPSERNKFEVHSSPSRGHHHHSKWYLRANHPVEAHRWTEAIGKSIEWAKQGESGERRRKSAESDSSVGIKSTYSKGTLVRYPESIIGSTSQNAPPPGDNEEEEEDEGDSSSSADSEGQVPPHETNFELHGNAVAAQMEMSLKLLGSSPSAIKESFSAVSEMMTEFCAMARERDEWWRKQLRKERARQAVWEESLATVVKEGETLEQELRVRSRKRGSRVFAPSMVLGMGTVKRRPSFLGTTAPLVEEPSSYREVSASPTTPRLPTTPARTPVALPVVSPKVPIAVADDYLNALVQDGADTDEEDEFFDAIESNNLPNLVVHDGLASPSTSTIPCMPVPTHIHIKMEPYAGYANLRTRLTLSDERPSTSLWSVLKHSIGKDLTRISFPVFFNEPTSMLQRMAEDMEFSECLDIAASEKDPLRRIAFVAAFAMSNYSSTIGRIAKPFNPMLSETFEYVRIDRKYRYVSEQVSHHPPISACWAESPSWLYYGEVDAQNKFMGKSFEIRPTGVAHADLLLPEAMAPGYPKAIGESGKGKVREHYSWKKVTTNVSGFILGSPTIDHYGDMVITNHRTGDQCILTFKPRGWRGKDAYEIIGQVVDASGEVAYEIAGRWNSQLIAKQVGVGNGTLHPDISLPHLTSSSSSPEYILLWRNSDKPPGSPFNLTPFAITLNDCPKLTLKPYLCPTDCRLRPDQRAQRAMRRAREAGEVAPHRPRWFVAETDGDTGERVWAPLRVPEGDGGLEYWRERERVWEGGGGVTWRDVGSIFVEEPEFVKLAG
ncbi:hypothetical protein K443DRAFT_135559 [Laccaria amethystina LaAM-08-1]|uniref:PH domain-containing protein n=1 Tax=Laccaria amethystina LaAM-08-1 TaxID=1095629 RepID=A0A0C9WMI1_9AGAR|nr:hypothetical protein K443DRAFT_135559 [Laccaria amethystina LaAM-08-1]